MDEFNNLNRCQSDVDCIVGQEDVGTDLPSPEPKCVTKAVIDRFSNWFESKNKVVSNIICSCDLTTNSCNTAWVTELCKYNEEFAENVSSSPDCVGKDWKCVDGWSMTVYYDRRLTNTTIFETNLPEKPKELINATIAEYGSSVCDCKNPVSYHILIGNKLEETDCVTFYKFIDDYKSSCDGCVRKWETECC